MRIRGIAFAGVLGVSGCLYDGGEGTRGLWCERDWHCGKGIDCIDGICGGPQAGGGHDGGMGDQPGGGGDEAGDGPSPPPECSSSEAAVCVGSNTLRYCDQGAYAELSCDDHCAAQGLLRSWGCHQGGSGDGCVCDPNSHACSPAERVECFDDVNVRVCADDGWSAVDCDYACVANGFGSTVGCEPSPGGAVCSCSDVCVENSAYCESSSAIRVCQGGSWVRYDCSTVTCDSGLPIGCGYLNGGDNCICLN